MTENEEKITTENTIPVNEASEESSSDAFCNVYNQTVNGLDAILENRFYPDILRALKEGSATVELRKRTMLRAIDETWINAIEDVLPSIDILMRTPRKFIEEQEYVLPISQSTGITPRSIRHLAQHVDYISDFDGENVTPSKILNVFREETIQTYENKFLNTLIHRLFTFVSRRYEQSKKHAVDSIATQLTFSEQFKHGDIHAKIHFTMELDEPAADVQIEKNYTYSTDLWRRVEKLYNVCVAYIKSEFAKNMGDAFVRSPIIHTNVIMKNKDFKQCLALWEFIESYENSGYTLLVDEHLESIDETYLRGLYSAMAVEYLMFREKLHGGFQEDKTLDRSPDLRLYTPRIIEELQQTPDESFNAHYGLRLPQSCQEHPLTELDHRILAAIDESITEANKLQHRLDLADRITVRRSYMSRLIQASDMLQGFYTNLKNALLSYTGMKDRTAWSGESYTVGRNKMAQMTIKGKTLALYLHLDPDAYPTEQYHHRNAALKNKKLERTPFELRISSNRMLKYALSLIDEMMKGVCERNPAYQSIDFGMPYETDEQLIREGLIKIAHDEIPEDRSESNDPVVFVKGGANTIENRPRRSYLSKLMQAEKGVQDAYQEIKNTLLSYTKVKARTSFPHEIFTCGRTKLAQLQFKGKTLALSLALNPADFETNKYHHKAQNDAALPFLLRISSARAQRFAVELIENMMKAKEIPFAEEQHAEYHYAYHTDEQLLAIGLIKAPTVKEKSKPQPKTAVLPQLDYSFIASMTLADAESRDMYNVVKNALLDGMGIRAKIGKYYETFTKGRTVIARLAWKEGFLTCFLALNPDRFLQSMCPHTGFEPIEFLASTPSAIVLLDRKTAEKAVRVIHNTLFPTVDVVADEERETETYTFAEKSVAQLHAEGYITGELPPEYRAASPVEEQPGDQPLPFVIEENNDSAESLAEPLTEPLTEPASVQNVENAENGGEDTSPVPEPEEAADESLSEPTAEESTENTEKAPDTAAPVFVSGEMKETDDTPNLSENNEEEPAENPAQHFTANSDSDSDEEEAKSGIFTAIRKFIQNHKTER